VWHKYGVNNAAAILPRIELVNRYTGSRLVSVVRRFYIFIWCLVLTVWIVFQP
jgi:hypothetical protein